MDQLLLGLRAAGEETRMRLLVLCGHAELTVSELIQILGQSQPRVSRHLKLLCDAGLLDRFQEGSWVYYRLASKGENALLARYLVDLSKENDPVVSRDLERLDAVRQVRNDVALAYFEENASRWNKIRSLHIDDSVVEKVLLAHIKSFSDRCGYALEDFLDIGTGTGRMLELVSSQVKHATGIDNSREMLVYARANIEEKGLRNCQVRLGDMYTLPIANQTQDLVVIHQVLHYSERPLNVLEEAKRVLKPHGMLLVVDFAPHEVASLKEDHAHVQMGFDATRIIQVLEDVGFLKISVEVLKGNPLTVNIWSAELTEKSNS